MVKYIYINYLKGEKVMENKKSYEAPKVNYFEYDGNDILTQSSWNFNCTNTGSGNNAAPPNCDVSITTDNSQN